MADRYSAQNKNRVPDVKQNKITLQEFLAQCFKPTSFWQRNSFEYGKIKRHNIRKPRIQVFFIALKSWLWGLWFELKMMWCNRNKRFVPGYKALSPYPKGMGGRDPNIPIYMWYSGKWVLKDRLTSKQKELIAEEKRRNNDESNPNHPAGF